MVNQESLLREFILSTKRPNCGRQEVDHLTNVGYSSVFTNATISKVMVIPRRPTQATSVFSQNTPEVGERSDTRGLEHLAEPELGLKLTVRN